MNADRDAAIEQAHRDAIDRNEPGYLDPFSGLFVMTSDWLTARGECCGSGCRHCPWQGTA